MQMGNITLCDKAWSHQENVYVQNNINKTKTPRRTALHETNMFLFCFLFKLQIFVKVTYNLKAENNDKLA